MSCFTESGAGSNSCVVSYGPCKTPWPASINSSLLYRSKNTGLNVRKQNVLRKTKQLMFPHISAKQMLGCKAVFVNYPICFPHDVH